MRALPWLRTHCPLAERGVAAHPTGGLVARGGRQDEGEGDLLRRRGLPLSLHPSPWALCRIFSLGALTLAARANPMPPYGQGMGSI